MLASTFAGIVTQESSSHSHLRKCSAQVSLICEDSIGLKPIDMPLTSLYLIDCQASSIRSFSVPGSGILANCAWKVMPSGVALAATTSPTGSSRVVLPEQRDRQLELRALGLDDVAHAIRARRRRDALDDALLLVDALDGEKAVGAFHGGRLQ